jgi:predicted AAA+ superfamily ATPase
MISRLIEFPKRQSFFLFGPRQTGKTTLVKSCLPQHSFTLDLLNTDRFLTLSRDPSQFRREVEFQIERRGVRCIFIDEIQKVPLLLDEVHSLIEKYKCQFIMTGSSARKLKRGASNLLAGRAVERRLFSLLYDELKTDFDFEDAMRFGTLPALLDKTEEERVDFLRSYTSTYLKEEILAEGLVRNLGGYSRFLELAAANFGELVSYSNVAREAQLPVRTVQGYYEIFEDTLIGFGLFGWQESKRKQLAAHPKFFLFDNGVANSINGTLRERPSPLLRGRLFEQWIVNEIRAHIHYEQSEAAMFYWRTSHGAEVDVVLARGRTPIAAIEIKASRKVSSSHLSGLRSFHTEYSKTKMIVVGLVDSPYMLDKVKVSPWAEFLTSDLPALL